MATQPLRLKELSKKEDLFTYGHRMCAGCGTPIIVKIVLLASDYPVIACSPTGCLEVSSCISQYTAWKIPWIHSAFENAAATIAGVESMYKALKRRGKIDKEIKFVVFGGDGGTYDIGFQSLSGAMERGHDMLYICYDNGAYMNCLSTSSLIMTKDGIKKITEVKEGDDIYAFDQKTYQLVLKKCTGVFDNGIKDVYELETLHHSIKATVNHPFLVLKRNGRGRQNTFVWKMLKEIKIGDEVVTLKNLDGGKSAKFNFTKVKNGDNNEINIPESSSPDLMKYLGIYLGNDWARPKKGEVRFALPQKTKAREVIMNLHAKIFGNGIRADKDYVYINSVNLANFIDSLGFGECANDKKVPGWVFTLPKEEKEGFIQGLMLSDSYRVGKSCRYVSASEDLLKTLRLLLQTTDYRVGKIHCQTKKKGTKCVKRTLPKDSQYGYICFNKRCRSKTDKYLSQFLVKNKYFDTEKVKSIKLVGREPTLDLRVDGEHNFIADGIVVHNTGIQRSSATPYGADTTTCPAGSVIPGKLQQRKDLTRIMAAHNIPYVAQAAPSHWLDLMKKVRKAFEIKGPKFMNVLSPCNRGWRSRTDDAVLLSRLAVDTCYWPLYEVENGVTRITFKPKEKKPIVDFLRPQGRFRHLFEPQNEWMLKEIQEEIDKEWKLLQKCSVAEEKEAKPEDE